MTSTQDIYCDQILKGTLPVRVIQETSRVLAFEHTHPYWEAHIVVIPKQHIDSLSRIKPEHAEILAELYAVALDICRQLEARFGGCRLSTNVGAYQSSKHLHFYIHSGERFRNEDGSPVDSSH